VSFINATWRGETPHGRFIFQWSRSEAWKHELQEGTGPKRGCSVYMEAPRAMVPQGACAAERGFGTGVLEWASMARLRAILNLGSSTRAVLFCLLPGLVLATSLPAPACLFATVGDANSVRLECQDPLQDDTELPDGETSFDDFWIPANARR